MAPKKAAAKTMAEKKESAVKTPTVEKETAKAVETKAAKTVEKKTAAKKAAVKEQIVLQFAGKEIETAEMMKQVKDYWTKGLKNKVGDMKSVTLYLKPEESKVYFVVNGDVTGSIDL